MDDLTRFDLDMDGSMEPAHHGQWVRYGEASQALANAKSQAEYWRQLLVSARPFIVDAASVNGYGFARPDNPHDFSPDTESCTDEEVSAHKAACDAYDRGEYNPLSEPSSGWVTQNIHILMASWGIGSYSFLVPEAQEIINAIDKTCGGAK